MSAGDAHECRVKPNLRGLLQQLLDLRQGLGGGVLVQNDPDVGDTLLHALNALLVRSTDSADFQRVDLVDKAVCLVCQLTNDVVPLGEALVAAPALGEGSRVSTSTGVTAWTGNTFRTDALTVASVALGRSRPPGVAVAG